MASQQDKSVSKTKTDWNIGHVHETIISPDASQREKLDAYGKWSGTYDGDMENLKYSCPSILGDMLFKRLKEEKSLKAIDAGCGTGLLAPVLKQMAESNGVTLELVGVDFSKEMLEKAREKNIYESLIEADLNNPLPYPDGSFDCFVAGALFLAGHCGPSVLPSLVNAIKIGGYGVFSIRRNTYLTESQDYVNMLEKLNCTILADTVGHYLGPAEANYVMIQKTL